MMMNSNTNSDYSDDTPAREELLIARVVDDEAGPHDWSELEALAVVGLGVHLPAATAAGRRQAEHRGVEDHGAAALLELHLVGVHQPVGLDDARLR